MNHIAHVMNVIARKPGSPAAMGELAIDPGFARRYLSWRGSEGAACDGPDIACVISCCRALRHDLIGIPADGGDKAASDIHCGADSGLFVFAVVDGAFQTAAMRHDMVDLLVDVAGSPEAVGDLLRHMSDEVTAAIHRAVGAGAHGVIIGDDIAYQQQTLMSPDAIERLLQPLWREQVAVAHRLNTPVFFHSDGNLNAVAALIAAAGFDGLHGIEPAAGMNIRDIISDYGKDLCLMGNIDPAWLTDVEPAHDDAGQTPDRLDDAIRRLVSCARNHGGLIIGTCSGLHAGMSPARVQRMYELAAGMAPQNSSA